MNWKDIITSVAPAIGTALGGPLGGIATKFIADKLLGNPDASEEDVKNFVLSASPEQLIKLKELDNAFEIQMAQLEASDRDSARKRQTDISLATGKKDWTPDAIAGVFIVGYFIIQWSAIHNPMNQAIEILTARMQDALMLILAFFFGSSLGSRNKNDMFRDRR